MFRNILVSIDGSDHSDRALDEAIDIARADQARLTILTAINQPPVWAASAMAAGACAVTAADLEKEAVDVMRRAVERVPDDIPVTTIISRKPIRHALMGRLQSVRLRPARDGLSRPRSAHRVAARQRQPLRAQPHARSRC